MKTPSAPRGRACRPAFGLAALACFMLALAAPPRAVAQGTPNPPERLTYQGFLTDGNGVALGNTAPKNYDVIFRIWNSENQSAPANLLWAEQQTVTVDKGYFSVLLGEGASTGEPRPALSTLFNGPTASDRWVGITVKGIGAGGSNVDILPRLRLISSPYAFLAQQANKLVQSTGADLITANNNQVTVAGPVTATSFAGNGALLSSLNAANIALGTLSDARLSGNVALRNGGNTFNGNQILNDRLGLGVASPAVRLHAATAPGQYVAGVFESGSTVGTWLALDNTSAGGLAWQFVSSGSGNGEGAGKLLFGHGGAPGGVAVRMTLDNAGRVGIGTSFPGRTLHVNGSAAIEGSNPIEFGRGFTKEVSAGQIGYGTHSGGAGGSLDIVGAGTTASNRKVKILSEGRMTVVGGVNVEGGILARGGYPGAVGANNNGYAFTGNGGDNDSGMYSDQDGHVRFTANSVLQMSVFPSGVYIHGGLFAGNMPFGDYRNVQWNDSTGRIGYDNSSRRYKENISLLEDDFSRLLDMRAATYTRPDAPGRWEIGYIAEEFHDAGLTRLVEYDREGRPDGINYEKITLYLTEIARLQRSEIAELQSRHAVQADKLAVQARELAELRTRMASLEQLLKDTVAALKADGEAPTRVAAVTDAGSGH